MGKTIVKIVCENDSIQLRDEIRNHVSKKFYKNIKSSNAIILVNDIEIPTYKEIKKGDIIKIIYEREDNDNWPLYESSLDILYENDNYLIVNKRSNLLSIPTKAEPKSLYQEVLYYLNKTNQDLNVSILNRLDKETKGLVVIAKNRYAAYNLQPTHKCMIRKYKCLCHGYLENDSGVIKNYIYKDENSNKRFNSNEFGKEAISNYRVLKRQDNKTLVEFVLDTGRTHQIRLHTLLLNHPIIGDIMYGIDNEGPLCLCSYYVSFIDPFTKENIEISIESGWE